MKDFRFYFGGVLIIIGIILVSLGTLTLFGTAIYDLVKTDMSFWQIIWDSVTNWFIMGFSGVAIGIAGVGIRP